MTWGAIGVAGVSAVGGMMGKGGASAPDTSGLEEATRDQTRLQRQIYEEGRDASQPWYDVGVGSVSKLSDLLGIAGGSVMDRQGIYDEMLPQYTQTQNVGGGSMYKINNSLYDLNDYEDSNRLFMDTNGKASNGNMYGVGARGVWDNLDEQGRIDRSINMLSGGDSVSQFGAGETTTTDYEALNAAVEERLGSQANPEGFGSLLERFDLDKFEEDPGYQYRQDQANTALERQMASQGVTLGGGGYGEVNPQAYKAMQEMNQGIASQEYGNAYGRYNADNMNTYNMLMGTAGMGQGATTQMQQGAQAYANNVGNLQTGLATAQLNAQQAGQSGGGSMFGSMLGQGLGAYMGGGGSSFGNATRSANPFAGV